MTFQDDAIFHRVTTKFLSSLKWRQGLLLRYPADTHRNANAATLLQQLASAPFSSVEPDVWHAIKPHADQHYFNEVLSTANRAVGYSRNPHTINDYLRMVVAITKSYATPDMAVAQ